MQRTLDEFLCAYERKPWEPASVNCCLFLASWAIWLGHQDPARHLRETFETEEEFQQLVVRAGGVVPVVENCVDTIRGRKLIEPKLGAIGVIGSANNMQRQFGAIFNGARWMVRYKDCVGPMAAGALAIWEI